MQAVDELILAKIEWHLLDREVFHWLVEAALFYQSCERGILPLEIPVRCRERHHAYEIVLPVDTPIIGLQPALLPLEGCRCSPMRSLSFVDGIKWDSADLTLSGTFPLWVVPLSLRVV
jgi:hypothetical protein